MTSSQTWQPAVSQRSSTKHKLDEDEGLSAGKRRKVIRKGETGFSVDADAAMSAGMDSLTLDLDMDAYGGAPNPERAQQETARMESTSNDRAHVVYVNSLDTSEEDEPEDPHDGLSGSTSASDSDGLDLDDPVPSSRSLASHKRPIKLNSKLREHLRKQGLLAATASSVNLARTSDPQSIVMERGLVLYRPLKFDGLEGTVEEPGVEKAHDVEGPHIEEIAESQHLNEDSVDMDVEMG